MRWPCNHYIEVPLLQYHYVWPKKESMANLYTLTGTVGYLAYSGAINRSRSKTFELWNASPTCVVLYIMVNVAFVQPRRLKHILYTFSFVWWRVSVGWRVGKLVALSTNFAGWEPTLWAYSPFSINLRLQSLCSSPLKLSCSIRRRMAQRRWGALLLGWQDLNALAVFKLLNLTAHFPLFLGPIWTTLHVITYLEAARSHGPASVWCGVVWLMWSL